MDYALYMDVVMVSYGRSYCIPIVYLVSLLSPSLALMWTLKRCRSISLVLPLNICRIVELRVTIFCSFFVTPLCRIVELNVALSMVTTKPQEVHISHNVLIEGLGKALLQW